MQLSGLPLSRQLSAAKSKYYLGMTQTIYEAYKGMEKHYRAYRMDAIVPQMHQRPRILVHEGIFRHGPGSRRRRPNTRTTATSHRLLTCR